MSASMPIRGPSRHEHHLGDACRLRLVADGIGLGLALSVSQRTAEIGVRMALGADVGQVRRMMIWRGLRIALIGIAFGLAAALGLMQALAAAVQDLNVFDLPSYAMAVAALVVTALVASIVPARRAARVEPIQALRGD
jgi:ABC-type antimicrobial peptide transport system permease subunit